MRRTGLLICAILSALLLGGCRLSGELENQAYVLVMGIDRVGDGRLAITVRVPKVGRDAPSKGADDKDESPYLTFRATGTGWNDALEALQRATPRQMNLSHIELLVVSASLAAETEFPALMRRIARTPHLYTTARLAICESQAGTFVAAGETVIGTRMSAEIRAMLKHYAENGYIPNSSFAGVCYEADSIYSDPVAIWCALKESEEPAAAWESASPMKQSFSGAALFREGILSGSLAAEETRLLGLIRGEIVSFPAQYGGARYDLIPATHGNRSVIWQDGGIRLRVHVRLHALEDVCAEDTARMQSDIALNIQSLILRCQRLGCDPFGFAEAAAGHFLTVPEWLAFDWQSHYADAPVEVIVSIDANA